MKKKPYKQQPYEAYLNLKKRRKWTKKEDIDLYDLTRDGWDAQDIAGALNRYPFDVKARLIKTNISERVRDDIEFKSVQSKAIWKHIQSKKKK